MPYTIKLYFPKYPSHHFSWPRKKAIYAYIFNHHDSNYYTECLEIVFVVLYYKYLSITQSLRLPKVRHYYKKLWIPIVYEWMHHFVCSLPLNFSRSTTLGTHKKIQYFILLYCDLLSLQLTKISTFPQFILKLLPFWRKSDAIHTIELVR
jgi:hypothetical protein